MFVALCVFVFVSVHYICMFLMSPHVPCLWLRHNIVFSYKMSTIKLCVLLIVDHQCDQPVVRVMCLHILLVIVRGKHGTFCFHNFRLFVEMTFCQPSHHIIKYDDIQSKCIVGPPLQFHIHCFCFVLSESVFVP